MPPIMTTVIRWQAAAGAALLQQRQEAVMKLEDVLATASKAVTAAEKGVTALARQNQKEVINLRRSQQQSLDMDLRISEECEQTQVQYASDSLR